MAGGLELVEASQGGQDALADAAVGAGILDDLQVAAWAGGFDAEEHGALGIGVTTMIPLEMRKTRTYCQKKQNAWHYVIRAGPQKTREYKAYHLAKYG